MKQYINGYITKEKIYRCIYDVKKENEKENEVQEKELNKEE